MTDRFIVIADPPTPNGDLHVGHLSGPYFGADTLTRYLRLQGKQVVFLSNFDSQQPYVATAGRRLGMTAGEVTARFTSSIAHTLGIDAIEPDLMGHPDDHQRELVDRFFQDLYERGKLLAKDEELPYCRTCERYLFEAYLEGTCPHCGALTWGNGCEQCCLPNNPKEMGALICRLCRQPAAELRGYRGLFLPLSRYQEELRAHLFPRWGGEWHQRGLGLVLGALDRPLPDIPLTYVSDYGTPVGIPGFAGQIYNVRLEILPALIDTFDKWRERQPDGGWDWRTTDDYEVVCFHGYENSFQYMASFAALLLASRLGWKLPVENITNEFYLLDGKKFSTTRNHAVWGRDILSRIPSDLLRFYLALTCPEEEMTNFALAEFRDETDRRLTEPWNGVHRAVSEALASGRGRQSAPVPEETAERLAGFAADMEKAYDVRGFSLRRAARRLSAELAELAAAADRLRRLRDDPGGLAGVLARVQAFAVFAYPIMPRFACRLQRSLGWGGQWSCYRKPVDPGAVSWEADLQLPLLAKTNLNFSRRPSR
jgi:methionyl-tRNA synthetase